MDTFLLMNIEKDILQNIKNEDVIELIANKSSLLKNVLIWKLCDITFIFIFWYFTVILFNNIYNNKLLKFYLCFLYNIII